MGSWHQDYPQQQLWVERLALMTNAHFGRYVYATQQQITWRAGGSSRTTTPQLPHDKVIAFFYCFPRLLYPQIEASIVYQTLIQSIEDINMFARLICEMVSEKDGDCISDNTSLMRGLLLKCCKESDSNSNTSIKDDDEEQQHLQIYQHSVQFLVLAISYYTCTYIMNRYSFRPKHDHDDRGLNVICSLCRKALVLVTASATTTTAVCWDPNFMLKELLATNIRYKPHMFKTEVLLQNAISKESSTIGELQNLAYKVSLAIKNIDDVRAKKETIDTCRDELLELGMYDVCKS